MKNGKKGFTLVELMIVVVILGILAAIAIPLYMRFVQQAKTGEAQANLARIAKLVEEHYAKSGTVTSNPAITPGSATALVSRFPNTTRTAGCTGTPPANAESVPRPANSAAVVRAAYQPAINEWNCSTPAVNCTADTAWAQMKFELSSPIRYLYCYTANVTNPAAQTFAVMASGNLDGDTVWSRFERRGQTAADGSIQIGPLGIVNEDE